MEEKIQSYLNWLEPRYVQFANYKKTLVTEPNIERLTKHKLLSTDTELLKELEKSKEEVDDYKKDLNKITSAKFYKVWQFYCYIRDDYIKNFFTKLFS